MKKGLLSILFLLTLLFPVHAQDNNDVPVPYSLQDRDRIMRTEVKMEALEETMTVKFDSQQRQLDDLKTLFYWGFGILITLFVFMMGYLIWDRRTALKPALEKSASAEEKIKNLLNALREYSRKDSGLAEILRSHGLL